MKNLRMVASSEGITIDDESLHVIAHKADGAMRDALTIFDQTVAFCGTDVKYQDVLRNLNVLDYEYSFSLVDAFLKGDYSSAMLAFDEILTKGFNALHFVAALSSHFRDLIVTKSGGLDALLELPDSLKKKYKEQSDRCSMQFLYDALGITTQCESGYRASINPRLHIEFALMRLSFLMAKPSAPAVSAQSAPVAAPAAVQQPAPSPHVAPAAAPVVTPPQAPAPAPAVPQPVAPAAPAPAAPVAPAAAAAAPAAPAASAPAPAPAESPAEPQRRVRATRQTPATASMKSMMEKEPEVQVVINDENAPSEELLRAKWPELAQMYAAKQPRLASMLNTTTLKIEGSDEQRLVTFMVDNDAQKDWVESKLLHDLEGRLRRIVASSRVSLRVAVTPAEAVKRVAYMPEEKAKELMAENEEVKNLVKDLGLDVK